MHPFLLWIKCEWYSGEWHTCVLCVHYNKQINQMQQLSGRKGKTSIMNMRDVWVSWARLLLNVHSGNKNRSYSLVKAHSLKIVEWFISEEHCVIVSVRFFMFYISQRVGCDWDAILASFYALLHVTQCRVEETTSKFGQQKSRLLAECFFFVNSTSSVFSSFAF